MRRNGPVMLQCTDSVVFPLLPRVRLLASAMDGRINAAASLALVNQLPLLMIVIVKPGWSGFVPIRRAI